jgi:hypothetical protein
MYLIKIYLENSYFRGGFKFFYLTPKIPSPRRDGDLNNCYKPLPPGGRVGERPKEIKK